MSLSAHRPATEIPVGALWAICGALLYAVYLVMMRRRAENEEKLNMPMFFGKCTHVLHCIVFSCDSSQKSVLLLPALSSILRQLSKYFFCCKKLE